MKVKDLKVFIVGNPPPSWGGRYFIFVKLTTDNGITGIGECYCDTFGPKAMTAMIEDTFSRYVEGMDPFHLESMWRKVYGSGFSMRPDISLMGVLSGLEIALWDIKGKALGVPVWKLLGGDGKPLFSYATGGYYELDAPLHVCADELAHFVKRGYKAVKLKTAGLSIEKEVERIRLTRAAIGNDVHLMLDMNAAYDLEDCIRYAHAVEPYNIYWLEEPLHWYLQPADFVTLAKNTTIPLAHGEREMTRFTARDFITSGALGFMQFDSTRFAGFTESLRVSYLAEQHGVRIAPHLVPEVHAHLISAFPRLGFGVESHGNADRDPLWFELFTERAQVKDGMVHLSDRPGFGFEIDWKTVKKYAA